MKEGSDAGVFPDHIWVGQSYQITDVSQDNRFLTIFQLSQRLFDLLDEVVFPLEIYLEYFPSPFRLTQAQELFDARILFQAAFRHAHEIPNASWQYGLAPSSQLAHGYLHLIKQLFLTEGCDQIFQRLLIKDLTERVSQNICILDVVTQGGLPEPVDIIDIADNRAISAQKLRDLRYPEIPFLSEQLNSSADKLCLLFRQRSWTWGEEHFQVVRASDCRFYVSIA